MSSAATLGEMNIMVRNFCEERDWGQFHDAKNLAIGLVTEASELLELFRYRNDVEVKEVMKGEKTRAQVEEEVADVLFLLLRFADRYQISLEKALTTKLELNAKKYPVERSRGSNKKYTEWTES